MGKTWKDKPLNVEDIPVYKRRKRTPKPQSEATETEVLKWFRETCENEYEAVRFRDPWNA